MKKKLSTIVLCTLGTRGDIKPFIEIARRLRSYNVRTVFLSNENWQPAVAPLVDEFHAIAPEDETQSGRDDHRFFQENTLPSFSKSFSLLDSRSDITADNTLIIYRSNMLGIEAQIEKYRYTAVKIALQPTALKSKTRLPWPLTGLSKHRYSRYITGLIMPLIYLVATFTGRYRFAINAFRKTHGLPPYRIGQTAENLAAMTIMLCPAWFAQPQPDWPANTRCAGFPLSPPTNHDLTFETFVRQHGSPVVATPGTGVTDINAFARRVIAACEQLALPLVFLSKTPLTLDTAVKTPFLHKSFIDLAAVLPESRLLIHHGGIGTTSEALRAGIPQIIFPNKFDQPDNAYRVAQYGIGAAVFDHAITTDKLVEIVQFYLTDNEVQNRLQAISADIQRTDTYAVIEGSLGEYISRGKKSTTQEAA